MQAAANSNLILTDLSSFKRLAELQKDISHGGFYQQIISELISGVYSEQIFTHLRNGLAALAEHAYGLRQMKVVEQASQLILNLPLGRAHESVARYYEALCLHRKGQSATARILLERVAEEGPQQYRAKALVSMSATFYEKGDFRSFLPLNVEAGRVMAQQKWLDPKTALLSRRNIALYRSSDGDHRGALADLENMFPLARAVGPWQQYLYYDYMNSLAVELCEVGRLEEAKNVSQIVLASPFAAAYPEWRETGEEIELRGWRPSRSTVAVTQIAAGTQEPNEIKNLVILPTAWRDSPAPASPAESQPPARVIKFPSRTPSMSEENDKEQLDPSQKRRLVADKLYEMFMASLEDGPIDVELVEKLWNVYLESRKKAK